MNQPSPTQPANALLTNRRAMLLLNSSGFLASVLGNGLPLLTGLGAGWPAWRLGGYGLLALIYVLFSGFCLLMLGFRQPKVFRGKWWLLLGAYGLLGLVLTALSGDFLVQPIVFVIPFVIALVGLPDHSARQIGGFYLALLALGLWLGGIHTLAGLLVPVAIYGLLLMLITAFLRIARDQQLAREQADRLAAELAKERDTMAALAAENARLAAEAAAAATLLERNRIARELHDTIAQGLTALTMQLEAAQRSFDRDPERSRARLGRAHELARETLSDVRQSVWAFASPLAESRDLQQTLADTVAQFAQRNGVEAHYTHTGAALDLPSAQAVQVLRIVQEALQNVQKHAQASQVQVATCNAEQGVKVEISDNGRGFDPQQDVQKTGGGFGLISLHERARLAGGELHVQSALGSGTRIALRLLSNPIV